MRKLKTENFIGLLVASALIAFICPAFLLVKNAVRNDVRICTDNLESIHKAKLTWRNHNPQVSERAMIHMDDLPKGIQALKCPGGGEYYPGSISSYPYCTMRTNNPPHIMRTTL